MSRESFVFVFGFLIFLIPFLGLPRDVKDILIGVIGALLMLLGFVLRRAAFLRSIENETGERKADAFTESPVAPLMEDVLPEHEALPKL